RVDVVDDLVRLRGIPPGRAAVGDAGSGRPPTGRVRDQMDVAQSAGQPDLEQVGVLRVRPAGDPSAAGPPRLVVHGTATQRIAQPVVEGPDPGAVQLTLDGLVEPGVAGHLAEVPAL